MDLWYVYIIQGKDKKLYTGITKDLKRRLGEHGRGYGGRYTKFRGPFSLIFYQQLLSKSEALQKEREIKKLRRNEKLDLARSFGC